MTDEYRHPDGLFVSAVDLDRGGTTVHIYDEDKTDAIGTSDMWRTSLCGQSWAKVNKGRSLRANKRDVNCGNCLRFLESRDQ